ncbi:MAG: response regulator [Campylobacterota bacterium]|nr:response regulator [Campylobacterota bacterium]
MNIEVINKIRKIGKSLKILYVEDCKDIAVGIEKLLLKLFTDVTYVETGLLGLAAYKKSSYDIVVTDISMPGMDGIAMTKQIKMINEDQIIIVTSAHNDSEKLIKLIELGVSKFIMKPIDVNLLLKTLVKITIELYNQKRKILLEEKLNAKSLEKESLIDNAIIPIVVLNRGNIEYSNAVFKNLFFVEDDKTIAFATLFVEENLQSMNKNELVQYLFDNQSKYHKLFTQDKQIIDYALKVSQIRDSAKYTCYLFNINEIKNEITNLAAPENKAVVDFNTGLLLRNEFEKKVSKSKKSDIEFNAISFGLKHIDEYIKKFGAASLENIYKKFAHYLIEDFIELLDSNVIEIYYFNTNKFVILVEEEFTIDVKNSLRSFIQRYSYWSESRSNKQDMSIDYLTCPIDKKETIAKIFSNIDNNLYMLKI